MPRALIKAPLTILTIDARAPIKSPRLCLIIRIDAIILRIAPCNSGGNIASNKPPKPLVRKISRISSKVSRTPLKKPSSEP